MRSIINLLIALGVAFTLGGCETLTESPVVRNAATRLVIKACTSIIDWSNQDGNEIRDCQ